MSFELIVNPWFYAAAIPAVVLTGISKGGFGSGLGSFAVPLMALSVTPAQAAAIMLPILMVMDILGLYAYRGQWDRAIMRVILPAGTVGIGLGWLAFRFLDDSWIRILLGLIAVGFALSNLTRRLPRLHKADTALGRFWAGVSGFTSFVAHAGGPPLNVYLIPKRLDTTIRYSSGRRWCTLP